MRRVKSRPKATVAEVPAIPRTEPAVLALHGFSLAGAMYDEFADLVELRVIAPDLPGHGGRDDSGTTWVEAIDEVIAIAAEHRPVIGLGYSMGGRLAVAAALQRPQLFTGLVLASTSLGIADTALRELRRRADAELADRLEAVGPAAWEISAQLGTSPRLNAIRRCGSRRGLAAALRGMGQASQPYLGDRLDRLHMPSVWLAGSSDPKYVAIAQFAARASPDGMVDVIERARHNLILDAPQRVAAAVSRLAAN